MKLLKIKFHYSFILLLVLSLFTGNLFILLNITFCIFIHELFHYVFIKLFNGSITSLEISIFGGMLEVDKSNLGLIKSLIIDFAGIISNIIIIWLLTKFFKNKEYLIYYNMMMIAINVFPIIPLDGYQITKDILGIFYEEEYLNYLNKIISIVFLVVMLLLIIFFKKYGLIFMWIFLIYKTFSLKRHHVLIKKYANFFKLTN